MNYRIKLVPTSDDLIVDDAPRWWNGEAWSYEKHYAAVYDNLKSFVSLNLAFPQINRITHNLQVEIMNDNGIFDELVDL